jgi:hypothetical protein
MRRNAVVSMKTLASGSRVRLVVHERILREYERVYAEESADACMNPALSPAMKSTSNPMTNMSVPR